MFKKRTVFIVGAGASAEFGLPVGMGLAGQISDMLKVYDDDASRKFSDRQLYSQLQRTDEAGAAAYREAFKVVSGGVRLSNSIDDFLDIHRQNRVVNRVGKAAIVKAILAAERNSRLHFDERNMHNKLDMARAEDTWLIKFVRMLGRGVALEDIDKIFENVTFIVFNYDRCIEHFLFAAIQQLYSISRQHAAEILEKLNIIHPYGDVGDLMTPLSRNAVNFGGDPHGLEQDNVASLADRIRTYTEVKENEPKENIDIALQDAESWVFLGFAYHEQNLKLLRPGSGHERKRIYATALGMSESDVEVVRRRLRRFFVESSQASMRENLRTSLHTNLTCAQLFDYYTLSLPA